MRSMALTNQGADTSKVLAKSWATTKAWVGLEFWALIVRPPQQIHFEASRPHASGHFDQIASPA